MSYAYFKFFLNFLKSCTMIMIEAKLLWKTKTKFERIWISIRKKSFGKLNELQFLKFVQKIWTKIYQKFSKNFKKSKMKTWMKNWMKICVKRFYKDMCDHMIFESQNLFCSEERLLVVKVHTMSWAKGQSELGKYPCIWLAVHIAAFLSNIIQLVFFFWSEKHTLSFLIKEEAGIIMEGWQNFEIDQCGGLQ